MPNNREILARHIIKKFEKDISGTDTSQYVDCHPEDKIFVGKLSPQSISDSHSSSILIKQISVDFRIPFDKLESTELKIYPKGNFFYRCIPNLIEQREVFVKDFSKLLGIKINAFDELLEMYKNGKLKNDKNLDIEDKRSLLPIYRKMSVDRESPFFSIKISDIYDKDIQCGNSSSNKDFENAISNHINSINTTVAGDQDCISCQFRDKVSIEDLIDEKAWNGYIDRQTQREEFTMVPKFGYGINVDIKKCESYFKVKVSLSNETQWGDETSDVAKSKDERKKDSYRVNTLFNSGIEIQYSGADLLPIELDYFANDYKYDRNVYALGNNCNVEYDHSNNCIRTTHIPCFIQNRLKTNDNFSVSFQDLIDQPVPTLRDISKKMDEEIKRWRADFESKKPSLSEQGKRQFSNEIKQFITEVKRYNTGVELISNYSVIRKAFICMNKSFIASAKGYRSWRLFQIVFIVSLILDIVAHEKDLSLPDEYKIKAKTNDVDVLFFPTGGGKTEAFLGILVFNLFFDRMRDKACGVTALLKYPLRLLSIQQVQRVSNVLASAEIIRREENLLGEEFSLGYYVGAANTPNRIDESLKKKFLENNQIEFDEGYRLLDICPYCGQPSVHVKYEEKSHRLIHFCDNNDCQSKGNIPLYMVDEEIYRYLPSVIISTVDKMTAVGMNMGFHNIIYGAHRKCKVHGYTDGLDCLCKDCKEKTENFIDVQMKDPAPTLLIQDELHLIKESLGTYNSHYETLLEYFIKELSGCGRGIKVIGATATISAYAEQAKHLYWKNAIRFPSESPYLDYNFYASIDKNDIGRIIIGYAPFGKAIVNSVAYAVQYLRRIVWDLNKNPCQIINLEGMKLVGTPEEQIEQARKLAQDYWVLLEYNNVKMESNRVLQAIEDPINPELIEDNIDPITVKKMTGDDSFQEVRSILSQIENASDIITDIDFNMIAATSMISHGVDANRFNLMLFYGIPGSTAEYIQAYSRVGRKHSGIVIDIIRPSREKDQSYLRNFVKFHDYKDILVDSVSINRWASRAVESTLPGIVAALILNHYKFKAQFDKDTSDISKYKGLRNAIDKGFITSEEIKMHAYNIYKCSEDDGSTGRLYNEKISKLVDNLFVNLTSSSFDPKMYIIEIFEKCYFRIMSSLRDTDKQLIIELE